MALPVTGRPSPRLVALAVLLVLALFLLPWVAGRYPVYLAMQILVLEIGRASCRERV